MKNLKIFSIALISFLSIWPVQLVNSCAWDDWDIDDEYLKPLDQEIISMPEYYPFLYSEHYWYHYDNWYYYEDEEKEEDIFDGQGANVREWMNYFNNAVTKNEILDIVYHSNESDFSLLYEYLDGKSVVLRDNWQNNGLIAYWKEHKGDPAISYLRFAKEVEPLVDNGDWWYPPERDTLTMKEFKVEAIKGFLKSKDAFIKSRYLYQAMRLAHYTGAYQECIDLYDQNEKLFEKESMIKYWCLSLKAGAYWRMDKFAASSYYNSIVFDKCPSRRLYAERDFWIDNEATWQKCLAMCKSDHERVVLWTLTGINQNNSAIPALKEMLRLDPSAPEIELLLAREIEKMQRNYMPVAWWTDVDSENAYAYKPESNDKDELFNFIKSGLNTNKVQTPAYWYNAAAFIQLINQNYGDCDQYCELATNSAKGNQVFADQARLLRILNKVEEYGKINPQIESGLMEDLKWLKAGTSQSAGDTYKLVMYRLMHYYNANNDVLDAEMCRASVVSYYDIYEHPDMKTVDELYAFFTSKTKRPFQDFLAAQYPYDADDMLEIKGTLLMRTYNWQAAIDAFEKMQNKEHPMMQLPTNPFLIHIRDCHDCDFIEFPDNYTKRSFAEEMLQLEKQAAEPGGDKAAIYHRLGNGYYNMTHFGNSWMAIDYYLSTWYWEWGEFEENDDEFLDCTKAAEYYRKAFAASKDEEFQAMNFFMLAKCEQNQYYISDAYDYDNQDGQKEGYRTNFAILNKKYKRTEFYKQAIEECKYFDYYVSVH